MSNGSKRVGNIRCNDVTDFSVQHVFRKFVSEKKSNINEIQRWL